MVPSAADIVRYRFIAAAVVRGLGVLILLYSTARVGFHLWDYDYLGVLVAVIAGAPTYYSWADVPKLHLVLGAAAIVMLVRSGRIARWLVPWPTDAGCPRCRFSLQGFRADRCPECGVHLGPDFHAPPASAGTGPGSPAPVQSSDAHSQ